VTNAPTLTQKHETQIQSNQDVNLSPSTVTSVSDVLEGNGPPKTEVPSLDIPEANKPPETDVTTSIIPERNEPTETNVLVSNAPETYEPPAIPGSEVQKENGPLTVAVPGPDIPEETPTIAVPGSNIPEEQVPVTTVPQVSGGDSGYVSTRPPVPMRPTPVRPHSWKCFYWFGKPFYFDWSSNIFKHFTAGTRPNSSRHVHQI